jgi:hypothetical protein
LNCEQKRLDRIASRFARSNVTRDSEEICCADDAQSEADDERELLAAGIVHDGGRRNVIAGVTRFEFGLAGGNDVLHPLTLGSVGEGDEKASGSAIDLDWRVERLAGFPADVSDDAESGQAGYKQAGDAIGDNEIERRDPARTKADQEGCGDYDYNAGDDGYS